MDSLGMVAQDYQNLLHGESEKNCPVVHPKKYIINDLLDRKGFANHSKFPKGTPLRSNRKIGSERGRNFDSQLSIISGQVLGSEGLETLRGESSTQPPPKKDKFLAKA